jgi:lactoylglutathione lyase
MKVERVKYVIWAASSARAAEFYQSAFAARVVKTNHHITELEIAGALIAIHNGGEGQKTWTGIAFQVPDILVAVEEVLACGGGLTRELQEEDGEAAHLAMCYDTEGNEFMLTRDRQV